MLNLEVDVLHTYGRRFHCRIYAVRLPYALEELVVVVGEEFRV